MAGKLKLSLAQIASKPGDIEANLQKLSDYARLASKEGAKIIITPELYLIGYTVKPASKFRDLAVAIPDDYTSCTFDIDMNMGIFVNISIM